MPEFRGKDPYLDSSIPLSPGPAAVAFILLPDGKYLLQLRDPLPQIFYPAHWGCFGGAIEPGETPSQALIRELQEELELTVTPDQLTYFTNFDFDFGFTGIGVIKRSYYVLRLDSITDLRLREGAEMRAFTAQEALGTLRLVPYDSFALWMHAYQKRVMNQEKQP